VVSWIPVSSTGMTRKEGTWMTGGALGCTHRPVIPARDAGIQEFYQVGKHKSYVKIHHFYGKLDPSVGALG